MRIRAELTADVGVVRQLNLAAFEGPEEARIVDALRGAVTPLISLVAEDDDAQRSCRPARVETGTDQRRADSGSLMRG